MIRFATLTVAYNSLLSPGQSMKNSEFVVVEEWLENQGTPTW